MNTTQTTDTVASLRAQLTALRTRNAPMRERGEMLRRLDAAVREQGPEVSPLLRVTAKYETCCPAGVVSFDCSCGHVVTCPTHGRKCHGTHD